MKLSNKTLKTIELMKKSYENDHSNCDDNTCSMRKAFECGYTVLALDHWTSSGAASDNFLDLFNTIPKTEWKSQFNAEMKGFNKDPDCKSIKCSHNYGAYIYDFQWQGNEIGCYNCGKIHLKGGSKMSKQSYLTIVMDAALVQADNLNQLSKQLKQLEFLDSSADFKAKTIKELKKEAQTIRVAVANLVKLGLKER